MLYGERSLPGRDMLSLTEFFFAVQAGLLAVVGALLMRPGHLLNPYYRWLEKRSILGWPDYITKPLGMCGTCFSGQVGLWLGLFFTGFNPLKTLFFAAISILINETKGLWLKQ